MAVWKDKRSGEYELWTATLADGKWTRNRPLGIRGADPTIACDDAGAVLLAWQDRMEVHVARSADGGKTFGAAERLGLGLFARVTCAADGSASVVWERFVRKGNLRDDQIKQVGIATSNAGGGRWPVHEPSLGGRTGQVLSNGEARPGGAVVLVWIDDSAGERRLSVEEWAP